MNKTSGLLIIFLGLLTLGGCATKPYVADPNAAPTADANAPAAPYDTSGFPSGGDNPYADATVQNGTYATATTPNNDLGDFYDDPQYGINVVAGPSAPQRDRVVYFAFDSANLDNRSINVLQQHAQYLRAHPQTQVVLEGHTDQRGTPDYNIALGERRAYAVKYWLQKAGVNGAQMRVLSYGASRPVAWCLAERCYARNRRVVINY